MKMYDNLDNIEETKGWWRKVICGKDYELVLESDSYRAIFDEEYEISEGLK